MDKKDNNVDERQQETSKVTKVILNDLKGRRVVYQNYRENKMVHDPTRKEEREEGGRKNRFSLVWRTLIIVLIIDAGLFAYFTYYKKVGFFEGLDGWVKTTREYIFGERGSYPDIQPSNRKVQDRKNEIKENVPANKIYTWIDDSGKQHYSNLPAGRQRTDVSEVQLEDIEIVDSDVPAHKKGDQAGDEQEGEQEKVLKYIVYLRDGAAIECVNISKNDDFITVYNNKGLTTNLDQSSVKEIVKYHTVGGKLKISRWQQQ